jgi:hypothetical protein
MAQTAVEYLEEAFYTNAEEFYGDWTISEEVMDRILKHAREIESKSTSESSEFDREIKYLNWLNRNKTE